MPWIILYTRLKIDVLTVRLHSSPDLLCLYWLNV